MVDSVGWMAAASEKGKKVLPGSEADVFDWLESAFDMALQHTQVKGILT